MPNRPAPRVLVHPDFLRLEAELVAIVRGLRDGPAHAFFPILILVPSRRQMARIRRVLAEAFGALAGVEVAPHLVLAYRLLENELEGAPPALLGRAATDLLVGKFLEETPGSPLAAYAREHPPAVGHLTGLLRELREAGVGPDALRESASGDARTAEVASLLARYERALADLAGAEPPWSDRAGLLARAAAAAPRRPPFRAVIQYGAYELVGMNLDLVRALPSETPPVFLVPADPLAPAFAYARDFTRRHLGVEPAALDDGADGPRPGVRAARLLRVPERPADPGMPIALIHAQGPEAELNAAARRALAWIRDGVAPAEIAILSRSLEPYEPVAETVFARHRLPVDSSATLALSRHPKARAFLLLIRALARGFERQTVVDLLRSPYFRLPEAARETPGRFRPDAWDRWSRVHHVVGGLSDWTSELPERVSAAEAPEWIREDPVQAREFAESHRRSVESVELLAGLVRSWAGEQAAWSRCRTAAGHARFLDELAGRWIRRWGEADPGEPQAAGAVIDALAGVLEDLAGLDAVAAATGAEGAGALSDVFAFVTEAVETARLPWPRTDGVRFLDVMQARGLTFRHVILLGFNADLMPRRPREHLLLPDAVRRRVRETAGRPLAVSREGREEEWLLFALVLTAATESLTVSWQRADSEGKARTVSLFLRELARALPGSPAMAEVLAGRDRDGEPLACAPVRVPTHPARAAEFLGERTGLLTREEAALVASERARKPAPGVAAFLKRHDPDLAASLAPGLALVETVDAFLRDPGANALKTLRYDGFLGAATGWERAFSSRGLEHLGRCPQTFFFRYLLGAAPLEEAADEYRFEARELGRHVHELLERVVTDLQRDGLLGGAAPPPAVVAAGLAAAERHWPAVMEPVAQRVRPRFPVLWENAERIWRGEIRAFLEADLRALAGERRELVAVETLWKADAVPLRHGSALLRARGVEASAPDGLVTLPLLGIPDRVTRTETNTWVVSDYKTSGELAKRVEVKEYLAGRQVQAPLYVLLAEALGAPGEVAAELLGLGPAYLPDAGFARAGAQPLDPVEFAAYRAGFEETLGVLAALALGGRFPFRPGRHCDWCDFRPACRRHHYPSAARMEEHHAYREYFRLEGKGKRKPTLAQVEAAEGMGA